MPGSLTINLSFGLLPVLSPVTAVRAPLSASTASLLLIALSINSLFESSKTLDAVDSPFIYLCTDFLSYFVVKLILIGFKSQ